MDLIPCINRFTKLGISHPLVYTLRWYSTDVVATTMVIRMVSFHILQECILESSTHPHLAICEAKFCDSLLVIGDDSHVTPLVTGETTLEDVP